MQNTIPVKTALQKRKDLVCRIPIKGALTRRPFDELVISERIADNWMSTSLQSRPSSIIFFFLRLIPIASSWAEGKAHSRTRRAMRSIGIYKGDDIMHARDPARHCLALLRSSTQLRFAQDDTGGICFMRKYIFNLKLVFIDIFSWEC